MVGSKICLAAHRLKRRKQRPPLTRKTRLTTPKATVVVMANAQVALAVKAATSVVTAMAGVAAVAVVAATLA